MTSKRRVAGKSKHRRFVMLHLETMKTPAFKSLTPRDITVLIHIMARHDGANNGRIPFSSRYGEKVAGLGSSTIDRALKVLIDRGFIVMTRRGWSKPGNVEPSLFRLTEFEFPETGQATEDFKNWVPGPDQKPHRKKTKRRPAGGTEPARWWDNTGTQNGGGFDPKP